MQPSPQTQVTSTTDEQVLNLSLSSNGSSNMPGLDASSSSNSTGMDEASATARSIDKKHPMRTVTWNAEVEVAKKETDDDEETLSMLGKRKLKAWNKQMRIEKRNQEKRSWKLWFWSQGCPCLDWSPFYMFLGNDDQSSMAAASIDKSSTATSTTADDEEEDDVGDDDSSLPSCSRVGSMLDGSIVSIDDENISDVSSNSSDGSATDETDDDEDEDDDDDDDKEILKIQAPVPKTNFKPKPKEAVDVQKDWSREGLSTNVISDMDVFMEAMRS